MWISPTPNPAPRGGEFSQAGKMGCVAPILPVDGGSPFPIWGIVGGMGGHPKGGEFSQAGKMGCVAPILPGMGVPPFPIWGIVGGMGGH